MIEPVIDDPVEAGHLASLPPDGITIFTLEGDSVRGALASGTRMLSLMRRAHGLGVLETLVLGKAYLAAGLLSVTIKGDDRLAVRADGSGQAQGYAVECTAAGGVRGRLFSSPFQLDAPPESLDTSGLVGPGTLSVTRFMAGRTEPFTGSAAAKTGDLARDLAWYFHASEQIKTSFTLGVRLDKQGRVIGAGGLYLQALPFASDEALERVERLVYSLPCLGSAFAEGVSRRDLAFRFFTFFDLNLLEERPLAFSCPCDRERMAGFLRALPRDERDDLAANGPFPVELACHNCGSVYSFTEAEIKGMLA